MTYSNSLLHLGCVVLVLTFVSGCGSGDTKVGGTVTLPDGLTLTVESGKKAAPMNIALKKWLSVRAEICDFRSFAKAVRDS